MNARTRLLALNTAVIFIPNLAATSSPVRPSFVMSRNASQVLGSTRLRTAAHALVTNSRANSCSRYASRSSRSLHGLENRQYLVGAGARPLLAHREEVGKRVLSHGPQPSPERPGRIVGEGLEAPGQAQENFLRHILCISGLQAPLTAPSADLRAVTVDKRRPGRLVHRLLADALQERHTRVVPV